VEKTSGLGLRDPVADGVKCRPHGGKNIKTKSWTVSWLSLKTKVEQEQCGSRVMSGDWRRLHRVRGVCSASPENHWVTRLRHKIKTEDTMRRCSHRGWFNRPGGGQTTWAGLTVQGRSDRPGHSFREASKRRTHVGIFRLASRLSKVEVAGHPSDGENLKTSKFALEGRVSLVI
jgi:hypothetical protein